MLFVAVLGVAILLYLSYRFLVYPAFLSPLSAVPNAHFTSSFCNAWMIWQRYQKQTNKAIHNAHQRWGPVVRLGLTEISVNSVEGLQVVYGGNFEKDEFYVPFANYGIPNMFSMVHRQPHTKRRRMFANIYSKSTLQSSAVIQELSQAIVIEGFLPLVDSAARDYIPLNMLEYSSAIYFDFDMEARNHWVAIKKITNTAVISRSWISAFPALASFLTKLGIPVEDPRIISAVQEGNDHCLNRIDKTELSLDPSSPIPRTGGRNRWTEPIVYKQLVHQLRSSAEKPSGHPLSDSQLRFTVASELMDHLLAGTETTALTLGYIMHELSHRPYLQSSLRSELLSLSPPILYPPLARTSESVDPPVEHLPSHRSIDNLPLLDAIVFESLRLHTPVPGSQLRVTPGNNQKSPISFLGYPNFPQGIRVSAQAYSLHRNAKIFPDPEAWTPERWVVASPEQRSEMMRWFWAFGSGANMCIGNHFALLALKLVVAAIYTNYTTRVIDDEGIEQLDGYAVGPKGDKLILQFERAG